MLNDLCISNQDFFAAAKKKVKSKKKKKPSKAPSRGYRY